MVQQVPDSEMASLACGVVVEASQINVEQMCPGFVESTFPHIVQQLKLNPQQLGVFRNRVATKLKQHVLEFMSTTYQLELSQLLQAVTPNQDPKLIRERVDLMIRDGDEIALRNLLSQIRKQSELRKKAQQQMQTPNGSGALLPTPAAAAAAQAQTAQPPAAVTELDKALTQAALSGDITAVRTVISQGANVNSTPEKGWTALMNASLQGHVEVVKQLISAGSNLNLKDQTGYTALMWAASYIRADVVEILVAAGADLTQKDSGGRDIWQYAQDPTVRAAIERGQASRQGQQPQQFVQPSMQPFGGQFPPPAQYGAQVRR